MKQIPRVSPGEPFSMPASTFNAFAAASEYFARTGDGPRGGDCPGKDLFSAIIVSVKNGTSAGHAAFHPVVLDTTSLAQVLTLANNERAITDQPVLKSRDATGFGLAGATNRIVIAVEPIPAGEVGRVCATGFCAAKVEIVNSSHRYAALKTPFADNEPLKSQATPSGIRIHQIGTVTSGVATCLVELVDEPNGPEMVQITSATRDSNGYYPANLMSLSGSKFISVGEVRFRGNDDTKCAVGENFDARFIGLTGSLKLYAGTGNADLLSTGVWTGGLVSINAQEFKGEKTFRDAVIIDETSTASELFVRGASALAKIGQISSSGAYTSMFAGASVLQHDYVQGETLRARIFAGETIFGKAAYITFPSTGIGAAAGASGEFNGYGSLLLNGFGFYSHSGTITADPENEEGHSSKYGVTRTKEGAVWGIDGKGKLNGPLGSSISITVRGGIVSALDVIAESGTGVLTGTFSKVGTYP